MRVEAGPIVAGGDALVRRNGQKTMFVEGALPGESVDVRITKNGKDVDHAAVTGVDVPSPFRITPPCPHFHDGCGGCQWQYAQRSAQQQFKLDIIRDCLARIAKRTDIDLAFAGAVPEFGYRTNMRMVVHNGRPALRRRHSNELVELESCRVAHDSLAELIAHGDFGATREVTLRVSVTTGQRLAIVNGSTQGMKLPSDVVVTDENDTSITEEVLGHDFRVSAFSFFQSGHAAATLLAKTVDRLVPVDCGWLIDAYSGVGLLGRVVASARNCRLTAIELNSSSARDARHNLRDLDAEVLEAEVAEVSLSSHARPDAVVADPARTGLGKKATRTLASLGAATFILVSCDPASFARDVTLLDAAGYDLERAEVLDLFPQTHHVEIVSTYKSR